MWAGHARFPGSVKLEAGPQLHTAPLMIYPRRGHPRPTLKIMLEAAPEPRTAVLESMASTPTRRIACT
jgi:hypothetical protein